MRKQIFCIFENKDADQLSHDAAHWFYVEEHEKEELHVPPR